MTKEKLVPVLN